MVTTGPIAESPQASQVEGRAVVGRRVRALLPFFGSTAFTISSTTSVPESSSSMSSNTSRAAERNSAVNSAISLRAAAEDLARRSARAASLARSATSMASSLRRYRPVSRESDGLRLRHRHAPKFQTRKRATRWP